MRTPQVVCIGEVMVEVSGIKPGGMARIGFGGDTANTAIYLSRLLGPGRTGYLTRLGDEPFGTGIADQLRAEGVVLPDGCLKPARQTGLYAISVDAAGERAFTYWRDAAPARDLLTDRTETDWAAGFDALYVSGITLAVLRPAGQEALLALMQRGRKQGKTVMFDTNLRPALWAGNHPDTSLPEIYARAAMAASIVKTGVDEVAQIFGGGAAHDHLNCPEIITTDGEAPVLCYQAGQTLHIDVNAVSKVVDATAAGDSFNAGYLAARLGGETASNAVRAGHILASAVIGYHGAIIPVDAMP